MVAWDTRARGSLPARQAPEWSAQQRSSGASVKPVLVSVMARALAICGLFLMVGLSFQVHAEAVGKQLLVRELLDEAGIREQIRALVPRALAELENSRGTLQSKQYAQVLSAFGNAYDPDTVYERMARQLEDGLGNKQLQETLRFYRSFVGQKIVRVEMNGLGPVDTGTWDAYYAQANIDPSTPHRLEMIRRLDNAIGRTELLVEVAMLSANAVATALDATLPPEKRLGDAKIRYQMAIMRPQLVQSHQVQTSREMLYDTRELIDPELSYYVLFLESESGKQWCGALRAAWTTILLQVAQDMSDALSAGQPS